MFCFAYVSSAGEGWGKASLLLHAVTRGGTQAEAVSAVVEGTPFSTRGFRDQPSRGRERGLKLFCVSCLSPKVPPAASTDSPMYEGGGAAFLYTQDGELAILIPSDLFYTKCRAMKRNEVDLSVLTWKGVQDIILGENTCCRTLHTIW